ncbi:hypothetical protein BN946_scf184998.g1 [Trametes cinnabarina]|uniref:DUF6589 domain-containing protein n=1 Tax=Pycnoporus cinnabarinus TaxID=5643 RepID=A0A060S8A4_PYCCI|nr:hypothetical protein BN946_scf184998.g1 [Trametes cinnabarina]
MKVTLTELFTFVLVHQQFNGPSDILYQDILNNVKVYLSALYHNPETTATMFTWNQELTRTRLATAVSELARTSEDWHFGASSAEPSQIYDFRLEDMGRELELRAPEVWSLVVALLRGSSRRDQVPSTQSSVATQPDDPEEDEYWAGNDVLGMDTGGGQIATAGWGKASERRELLIRIKTIVIVSILIHNNDQRCNALQSIIGIFLHSCGAPEKLIKVLSRSGLSISLASIHRAIHSLTVHSADDVEELAQTLLASYAFDNLDTKLPVGIPTVESPADGLIHIATGTVLRLDHGVSLEDLRCSKLLWDRSPLNPLASDPRPYNPEATFTHLLGLHPEPEYTEGALSRRGQFRAWVAMQFLAQHGPSAFAPLHDRLRNPETVEMIPIKKLYQTPLRAMDINLSTITGNINTLSAMFAQGGVGDPWEDPSAPNEAIRDISEYVAIVHGDLGTYEKVDTAMRRRKQERTPYNRLQHVVMVPGLFHLKMAAADAIWRILITPDDARVDHAGFMKIIGQLRPDDSSRLRFQREIP